MRPTVKDVAALAGVSPKTVSNVINGVVFVRPDTVERVKKALDELDYVPNLSARNLRNGRSGVFALSLPDLGTPYSAEMMHAFVSEAHARGFSLQIDETALEPGRERSLVSRARDHLVDGLIVNPIRFEDSIVQDEVGLPPLVVIGEVRQQVADQVWVDPVQGAGDMTRHLLETGRRRIAIVGAPEEKGTSTAGLRTEGYRAALTDARLALDPRLEITTGLWTPRGGAEAVGRYLDGLDASGLEVPDAFFCFTDSLALGVVSELWRRGLSVPGDIAVAGFDDIEDGLFGTPPLTTVSFDKAAFAGVTLDLLIERLSDREAPPRLVAVPHRVLPRASTAPAPRG